MECLLKNSGLVQILLVGAQLIQNTGEKQHYNKESVKKARCHQRTMRNTNTRPT